MRLSNRSNLFTAAVLIAIIVACRLLPHPPNFAPAGAVSLISALYLRGRGRFVVPLLGMAISDGFIGLYRAPVMASVYGSLLLIYPLGLFIRRHKNLMSGATVVCASSLLFFVITNFAVWAFGDLYPHTINGLYLAYAMAIPFYKNTLVSDLLYCTVLAGVFEFVPYALRLARAQRTSPRHLARTPG